ncbi:TonB-dependent receptor [Phenylobacterium sp. LH3H17]|uniref:TonB-dependent receptor n=1 Tax=Phenylobacterium sp. LH3H17 TaxID=2903901 RepID=UPI0020CA190D|nr:TonB-dependent receptor [Phenylobacterium sp. LH3H17]UTP38324.1 TonB-dependent receptor [Phenylobacterium sp. LH3H17]
MAQSQGATQLEELVVTAEKREANVQTTPISISAISAAALEQSGIKTPSDLQFLVPNLAISSGSGGGTITIRGFGRGIASGGADPSSTLHIDGVYIARPMAVVNEMLDISRVEVLRGPQGTLYGRNAVGGTINLITNAPSAELQYGGAFEYSSFNTHRGSAVLSGRLSADGAVRGRLALLSKHTGGRFENVFTRRAMGEADIFGARAGLDLRLGEDLKVLVQADYSEEESDGFPYKPYLENATALNLLRVTPARGDWDVSADAPTFRDVVDYGVSATAETSLGPVGVKSITAFRDSEGAFLVDLDVTNSPLGTSEFAQQSDQFSQELQFTSQGDGQLQWIAGLFYLHDEGTWDFLLRLNPNNDQTVRALFAPTAQRGYQENELTAKAIFGEVRYAFSDDLRLTLGLRHSNEEKRNVSRTGVAGSPAAINLDRMDLTRSWDAWTPRVVLDYSPAEGVFTYATVSRGFKSGGFNLRLGPTAAVFDPEYVWNYEVGAKTEWFDRRLQVNLSLFKAIYTDQQVQVAEAQPNGTTVVFTRNAGESKAEGAELEVRGRPTPALQVDAAIGYLHARFTDYPDGALNHRGKQVPGAPEWTASFGAQYTVPVAALGDLVLRGEYQWRDTNPQGFLGTTAYREIPSYGLVNARATLRLNDGRWAISAFAKNLTDEAYSYAVETALLARERRFLGERRTFGVQLSFEN